ncbi:sulfatase-like hydrolase/transferase [Flavobacteriaceae bacterium]|nr:sulfatase-like hydrolase/transferase [Flavobacteriaceae bacterium]
MTLKKRLFPIHILVFSLFLGCAPKDEVRDNPPNIIYILADDLGYGDLSIYNQDSKIKTPHLDQLAREGMRFMDMHSTSSVCTPTRYSILTGEYAWRTSLKTGSVVELWPFDDSRSKRDRCQTAQAQWLSNRCGREVAFGTGLAIKVRPSTGTNHSKRLEFDYRL